MPKSKRNKVITLTKTKKKTRERKNKHIDDVQKATAKYSRVYLLNIDNDRNNFFKEVRRHFRADTIICAKNKVMQHALGITKETECQDNIHQLAQLISGKCGLLFTNKEPADVQGFFASFKPVDYARCGAIATTTVTLPKGFDALAHLAGSIENHLRSLGLPTRLHEGRIQLLGNHTVCKEGQEISADIAQILKLLDVKMARFAITVEAHWSKAGGGTFVDCNELED